MGRELWMVRLSSSLTWPADAGYHAAATWHRGRGNRGAITRRTAAQLWPHRGPSVVNEARKRREKPYVFVELPSCDGCGCIAFEIDKTITQDDGSKLQYARCRAC